MKQIILPFLLLFLCTALLAQKPFLNPCGTAPVKSEWLKNYQQNPNVYRKGVDTVYYVPMSIHSVASDVGLGHISILQLLEGFCTLNEDFRPGNIQFFIEDSIHRVHNTSWYNHPTVVEGHQMMTTNNIPHTINTYVVSNPAGNAGYNLPSARAVAMQKNSLKADDHTWSHEIGHNLSVQHTFLGWEGNTYGYNFADTAPTLVFYDYTSFKDSFYNSMDTTIIDSALVELVDGSNCMDAADGFCDTPPDYLAFRWNCNGNTQSPTLQHDPHGTPFRSDATNIMNYSFDACQSKFTPQQIGAMRANLLNTKADYLYNQNPNRDTITQPMALLEPQNGSIHPYNYVEHHWAKVDGATHYLIQVSPFATFTVINEIVTTDTFAISTNLIQNRSYYWRVKPFNQTFTCAPVSQMGTFQTSTLSSTNSIEGVSGIRLYPNPVSAGQFLTLETDSEITLDGQLSIYGITGKLMTNETILIKSGLNAMEISTSALTSSGIYIVTISTEKGRVYKKIVVE